jgi:hypothetical protein
VEFRSCEEASRYAAHWISMSRDAYYHFKNGALAIVWCHIPRYKSVSTPSKWRSESVLLVKGVLDQIMDWCISAV